MKKMFSVAMLAAMLFGLAVSVQAATPERDGLADGMAEGTITVINLAERNELFEVLVGSSWRVIRDSDQVTLPMGNYTVRIVLSLNRSGVNQHHVEIPNVSTGAVLNRDDYVHTVTVPEGVTVRSIATPGQQRGTIVTDGIPRGGITAGNTLDLPISGRNATMMYLYNGESRTLEFVLDGSNPFNRLNTENETEPEPTPVSVSNARFVSVKETGNRLWTVTFTVDVYADGGTSTSIFTFTFKANNANQSGNYTFAADHPLAGYTLTYDIRGNGSNIRAFSINKS